MTQKNVIIELGPKDKRLTVASLIDALEKALAALRGMEMGGSGRWEIVAVKMNSPLRMTVCNPEAAKTMPTGLRMLRSLEKYAKMPKHMTAETFQATRELAHVVRNDLGYMKISYGRQPSVKLTEEFTKHVDAIAKLSVRYHYEWTTLEGMLSQITVMDETTKFKIIDRRTGRGIDCTFAPAQLSAAKDCLPHRVSVFGIAKYNAFGEPVSMEVREFKKLKPRSELPQFSDLGDIDITSGVDSVEYVRRMRDGG